MYLCVSWKVRQADPAKLSAMMERWGAVEAGMAEHPEVERVAWFTDVDLEQGFTVMRVVDPDAAMAYVAETCLVLAEFFEFDARPVLDLEGALPSILKGMERLPA